MKLKQISSVLFLSVLVFSCEKNDSGGVNLSYPSTYHKSGIKENGEFRVFAPSGEITDPAIVKRFKQTDTLDFFYFAGDLGINTYMSDIHIVNAQNAVVTNNSTPGDCIVSIEGDNIILTRTDTTSGSTGMNELTRNVEYYIGQVKPEVYDEWLISSTRGDYVFGYYARKKFVLRQPGGQLVAPIILYIYRPQASVGYQHYYVNNLLQNDFYLNLEKGDTVTLKEYFITYEDL